MFDKRVALEAAGIWVEGQYGPDWNDETRAWHAATAADFSKHVFQESVDFSDFVFPGNSGFGKATFTDSAVFDGATFTGNARFSTVTFASDAWFDKTTFADGAMFREASFTGSAAFNGAVISGVVGFNEAIFSDGAWFDEVTFTGGAWFGGVTFAGNALFSGATFAGNSGFSGATFADRTLFNRSTFAGDIEFLQAVFEGYSAFEHAKFERYASFRAIEAKSLFSLAGATFLAVPDFNQAHFAEAPRLDDFGFAPRRFWPATLARVKVSVNVDLDLAARWRALKRLAIQGHDHASEQVFFKGELKARRWSEDKPWHAVFWFGVFYELLSDFGRSIWRPFMWWVVSVLSFAILYLAQHSVLANESSPVISAFQRSMGSSGDVPPLACVAGSGEPWLAALLLSAQKGLVFLGQVPINKLNQIYACLYGIHPVNGAQPSQLPASFSPVIPDGVTAVGFLQYPLSATLIFLFLLAIRNHFRIR